MALQYYVIFAIAVSTVIAGCIAAYRQNQRKLRALELHVKNKKSESKGRRNADNKRMSRSQQKKLIRAIELIKTGKTEQGTNLLKSNSMVRKAVDILVETGNIVEASTTLLHIDRPNRAGNLLALNGMWTEAAICFQKANMPTEEANCYRSKGDFSAAAKIYVINEKKIEAADCYVSANQLDIAAQIYMQEGQFEKAVLTYQKISQKNNGLINLGIERETVTQIRGQVVLGHLDQVFIDILHIQGELVNTMLSLLENDKLEQAINIVKSVPKTAYETLISSSEISGDNAEKLAFVLLRAENIPLAGIMEKNINLILNRENTSQLSQKAQQTQNMHSKCLPKIKSKLLNQTSFSNSLRTSATNSNLLEPKIENIQP